VKKWRCPNLECGDLSPLSISVITARKAFEEKRRQVAALQIRTRRRNGKAASIGSVSPIESAEWFLLQDSLSFFHRPLDKSDAYCRALSIAQDLHIDNLARLFVYDCVLKILSGAHLLAVYGQNDVANLLK
jgi:hypothetical protein